MSTLFVRRPNAHYQLLAILVLFAMVLFLSIGLDGHKPLP